MGGAIGESDLPPAITDQVEQRSRAERVTSGESPRVVASPHKHGANLPQARVNTVFDNAERIQKSEIKK